MKHTKEDIPLLLNNISWQLKRIADSLEQAAQTPRAEDLRKELKVIKPAHEA
jgi:ABC-type molybdate transport system permease subunit